MSNFLTIASVTAVLKQNLQNSIGMDFPGAKVTTHRPDTPASGTPEAHVNLYLYKVAPNAAWRNADLPTRRTDGELVQRPQVALDLQYLLSFFGDDLKLEPQRLLGSVVRTLHASPLLTREAILQAKSHIMQIDPDNFIKDSDLAEQIELIKFSPLSLNLEELSKLWSVFFQTPYTLSVAYQASVVLIEGKEVPHRALPVRERNLYIVQFRQPIIEQVISDAGPGQPILAGSKLIILGKQLRGDVTLAHVGGTEVTPEQVTDTKISLQLPYGLQAGVHGVQIMHQMLMGTPPKPHLGVESNVAAFVLCPSITASASPPTVEIENNVTLHSADVTVTFNPNVGKRQRVILMLNEFQTMQSSLSAQAYSFNAPSDNGITDPNVNETNTITFHVSKVVPGKYLVRVQVDGAESPLGYSTGQYDSPLVTL